MAITRATNLANIGSGIGTNPSQPIDVGIGITIDGNSGVITATSRGNFGNVTIDGTGIGIITANTFSGTAINAGSASGLGIGATGYALVLSQDLTARHVNASGIVTATDANFTGNVSIAGTLTYEDVTNIDSVGLITARNGLQVLAGITTISGQTNLANVSVSAASTFSGTSTFSGKISANSGVGFTGFLREGVNIISGKLSDNTTINIDHSMAHYFTTTESTTGIPNFTSTAGINTDLSVGQTFSVNVITTAAAAGYSTGARIDAGATLPVLWNGGSDPSEGGSAGVDLYTYQVIKTGSAAFTVLGNVSNFA